MKKANRRREKREPTWGLADVYPDLAASLERLAPRAGGSLDESVLMDLMTKDDALRAVEAMVGVWLNHGLEVDSEAHGGGMTGILVIGVWLGQKGIARVPE